MLEPPCSFLDSVYQQRQNVPKESWSEQNKEQIKVTIASATVVGSENGIVPTKFIYARRFCILSPQIFNADLRSALSECRGQAWT